MKKKVVVCMAVLGLGLLALAGCGKKEASADAKELNVQFVPTNNDGSMEAKAKPFAQYLSEKLGCKVNVTLATDYSTIVEAMASGKVDIGIMPPAAYVQARDQRRPKQSSPPSWARTTMKQAFLRRGSSAAHLRERYW